MSARERGPWRLEAAALAGWVDDLVAAGRRVYAPVEEDGRRELRPVRGGADVCLAAGKTRWSPKEQLFPRAETLFRYRVHAGEVSLEPPAEDAAEQVLFGVRACDAAGIARLDSLFGAADATYAARRARTTVVALGCDSAGPECFCSAVGGAPDDARHADVQVLPVEEAWVVRALTERGRALTATLPDEGHDASDDDLMEAEARGALAAFAMQTKPMAREWAAALEASFGAPLWEAVGRRCLGCSICTYVCPSCSCFDVTDAGSEACGERCRSWDSCTFAVFTRHATGHNPRATQASRFRQRVLHKFAYWPQTHEGQAMCTGCGRCVLLCPVGLDVRETVERVALAGEEVTDAGR